MPGQDEPPAVVLRLRGPRRLLTPQEVRRLLGISRTTLHDWTVAGRLEVETSPTRYRKYPADQEVLQAALAAQLEAGQ